MKCCGTRLIPNSQGSTHAGQITSTKVMVISELLGLHTAKKPRKPNKTGGHRDSIATSGFPCSGFKSPFQP